MKRLALLGVGSAIILGFGVMGASPAFADNGPHQSTKGSLTVDRCAGCHRAHTAQAAFLLTSSSESTLCGNCHGSTGTGATTDVMDGVAYSSLTDHSGSPAGALRGGGFTSSAMNAAAPTTGSVGVLSTAGVITPITSTSKHNVDTPGTIWGGGLTSASGVGTSTTLECSSCHDPHGNGNYRILRNFSVMANEGGSNLVGTYNTAGVVSITEKAGAPTVGTSAKYFYDVVTSAATAFKVGSQVNFYNMAWSLPNYTAVANAQTLTSVVVTEVADSTHITVRSGVDWIGQGMTPPANQGTANLGGTVTVPAANAGTIGWYNAAGIAGASSSVTAGVATYTFYTWAPHGLANGQTVTISGMLPATLNVTKGTVSNVTLYSFQVSGPVATLTAPDTTQSTNLSQGVISGIPDVPSGQARVYTIANYWTPDDHNYTGSAVAKAGTGYSTQTAAAGGPSGFITNISQWCATCHTRLLAGPQGYATDTTDATYRFMHRSNNGAEGSPNCITCHVAHGTNASMAGDGKSIASSLVNNPSGTGAGVNNSFLLRVDNRGTCNMCHDKDLS